MIIFKGQISGQCKKDMLLSRQKHGWIGGGIAATIFAIPVIIFSFKVHWAIIFFLPLLVAFAYAGGAPPSKKYYGMIMPESITIYDDGTIIGKSDQFELEYTISDVASVEDRGEWYHIHMNDREDRFACQKSLITQGTLEEFEELFKDVLVKETK